MLEIFAPGRVAVITGAASGIGRATALKLARNGMKIAIIDTNRDKLPLAETEIINAAGDNGANILSAVCDVSDATTMDAFAADIIKRWGPPSFLMNNAAIHVHGGPGGILDPIENWRKIFDINLFGIIHGVQAFLPAMLANPARSCIVNTGSKQGLTNPPGNPAYNSVKAAVNAYTQNLAHDLRNRTSGQSSAQVSAHLLVPGWTTTGDNDHKKGAWQAEQVVSHMINRLTAQDFYIICPDDETSAETDNKRLYWQAMDMIENRPALSRWHPDYAKDFEEFMARDLPKSGK